MKRTLIALSTLIATSNIALAGIELLEPVPDKATFIPSPGFDWVPNAVAQ